MTYASARLCQVSCFQIFGLIRPEFCEFINTEKDEGEKPEAPTDGSSNPTIFIHSRLTALECWGAGYVWWKKVGNRQQCPTLYVLYWPNSWMCSICSWLTVLHDSTICAFLTPNSVGSLGLSIPFAKITAQNGHLMVPWQLLVRLWFS